MPDSPKRIMIAESEANFARTLCADMEKRGYDVTLCHDGLECVAALRQTPPALLIVDTQLPVLHFNPYLSPPPIKIDPCDPPGFPQPQ